MLDPCRRDLLQPHDIGQRQGNPSIAIDLAHQHLLVKPRGLFAHHHSTAQQRLVAVQQPRGARDPQHVENQRDAAVAH
jgi:hypothetical protein